MQIIAKQDARRVTPNEEFAGLSTRHAKRRALSYWYAHQGELEMTVSEFFAHCRLSTQGGLARITFYGTRPQA